MTREGSASVREAAEVSQRAEPGTGPKTVHSVGQRMPKAAEVLEEGGGGGRGPQPGRSEVFR